MDEMGLRGRIAALACASAAAVGLATWAGSADAAPPPTGSLTATVPGVPARMPDPFAVMAFENRSGVAGMAWMSAGDGVPGGGEGRREPRAPAGLRRAGRAERPAGRHRAARGGRVRALNRRALGVDRVGGAAQLGAPARPLAVAGRRERRPGQDWRDHPPGGVRSLLGARRPGDRRPVRQGRHPDRRRREAGHRATPELGLLRVHLVRAGPVGAARHRRRAARPRARAQEPAARGVDRSEDGRGAPPPGRDLRGTEQGGQGQGPPGLRALAPARLLRGAGRRRDAGPRRRASSTRRASCTSAR